MKKLFFFTTVLFFSLVLNAQTQSGNVNELSKQQSKQSIQDNSDHTFKKENLRFGGSFGASFGAITSIDVSPSVGYQFYPRFQAGLGLTYNYYATDSYAGRFSMNIYGVSPYAEFMIIKRFLLLRAEYGLMNYNTNFSTIDVKREWVPYPLVGAGIFLPMGQTGGISALIMWNLNETDKTLYTNPILRIGFSFGL
ncbi:MAG: hypothetical protein LBU91_08875 [Bacteroidales bacterium]|jgi:hypothetical protein|nr:hypothetical protein [Bacteroidales bacterium]